MNVQLPLIVLMLAAAGTYSVSGVSGAPGAFVCGGVGSDERRELAQEARGANLALEFFVAGRGDYVTDVDVELTPVDGGTAALEVTADGPICYVKLPPGRYRVQASFNGVTRSARATLPARASRPVRIALAFPEAAAHGDLETRPTPEEREEARTP